MKILNQNLYGEDLYLMVFQEIALPGTPEMELLGCLPLKIEKEKITTVKTETQLISFFKKECPDCDVVLMKFTPEGPKVLVELKGKRPLD